MRGNSVYLGPYAITQKLETKNPREIRARIQEYLIPIPFDDLVYWLPNMNNDHIVKIHLHSFNGNVALSPTGREMYFEGQFKAFYEEAIKSLPNPIIESGLLYYYADSHF